MTRDEIISGLEAVVRDVRKEPAEKMLGVCITADEAEEIAKLLKEQEPILVKYTTSTIRCPKCNKQITNRGALHNDINYCWKCGQAVKWNEIVYARNDGRASDAR